MSSLEFELRLEAEALVKLGVKPLVALEVWVKLGVKPLVTLEVWVRVSGMSVWP